MQPIYIDNFTVTDLQCDRFGRLKPASICWFVQEMAGQHCLELKLDWNTLASKGMFWAIIRHKAVVQRLPQKGETIRIETWPMPTTRVAYPRNVVAFDQDGKELFRSISIWVLMDMESRAMILPGKSGITVDGILRGGELSAPGSLAPVELSNLQERSVRFSDLDINGHMNNCRYLDWAADLMPSRFHQEKNLKEFTLGYLSEAREGDDLRLSYDLDENGDLRLEIQRENNGKLHRVFCADMVF